MSRFRNGGIMVPWLSARVSNQEKRFIQVGDTMFFSKRFSSLGIGARWLYLCMAMEAAGHREFQFTESTGKKYAIPHTSLRRYIDELLEAEMITRRSGKICRLPNQYAFKTDWKSA